MVLTDHELLLGLGSERPCYKVLVYSAVHYEISDNVSENFEDGPVALRTNLSWCYLIMDYS